jgi:hypothetical protein
VRRLSAADVHVRLARRLPGPIWPDHPNADTAIVACHKPRPVHGAFLFREGVCRMLKQHSWRCTRVQYGVNPENPWMPRGHSGFNARQCSQVLCCSPEQSLDAGKLQAAPYGTRVRCGCGRWAIVNQVVGFAGHRRIGIRVQRPTSLRRCSSWPFIADRLSSPSAHREMQIPLCWVRLRW